MSHTLSRNKTNLAAYTQMQYEWNVAMHIMSDITAAWKVNPK